MWWLQQCVNFIKMDLFVVVLFCFTVFLFAILLKAFVLRPNSNRLQSCLFSSVLVGFSISSQMNLQLVKNHQAGIYKRLAQGHNNVLRVSVELTSLPAPQFLGG